MSEAVTILCEWAWRKVNLGNLQRAHAPAPEIEQAIHDYQRALRQKKKLDAANTGTDHLSPEDVGLAPEQLTLIEEPKQKQTPQNP